MVWKKNMSEKSEAIITENLEDDDFTRVTFFPDLEKFGMEKLDGDILSLMRKRVIIDFQF